MLLTLLSTVPVLKDLLAKSRKTVLLGAGSDLRADDAAGLLVCREVEKKLPQDQDKLTVIAGETAPENFTGVIVRLKPDLVVLVDTVDAGRQPGTVTLYDPEDLDETNMFSTHKLPLKVLIRYLQLSLPVCRIAVLGIEPETLDFGKPVSAGVKKATLEIARIFL